MAENNIQSKQRKRMEETLAEQEEIVAEGEDGISELPDSVLAHILSLLSFTREAIRTSVLSKRWQYLWTLIPVINLHVHEFDIDYFNDGFFSSVDRTLARRGHNKLQKFVFITSRRIEQHHSHLYRWISYVIRCNVENLMIHTFPLKCDALPEHLFRNSFLKELWLGNCNWEPIGEISWKNLKCLRVGTGFLTHNSIDKLLSGSPSLETLELQFCSGFDVLDITSTSLKKLIVQNHCLHVGTEIDQLKIKAPNILSLEINGFISSEIMLIDVGSVVEATLDFKMAHGTAHGKGKVTLKRMIESLKHVNKLKIGLKCLQYLMSLEMTNWSSPISRCKYLEINMVKGGDSPGQEIKLMGTTPHLVFMNECASIFTCANNEIISIVLGNAVVLEKVVIRASPECVPEAKILQSFLKLHRVYGASKEEVVVV